MATGKEHGEPPQQTDITHEFSGAIGDLGTFLPHVLAAITVVGLNPTAVFASFGFLYLFSGWFYGIPMAVQPMKAASAAVLVQKCTPGEVAAAGILIGAILLLLAITGLVDKLARITPAGVTGGIQVGLGLSLSILGLKMVGQDPWLGWPLLAVMFPLLNNPRLPASIFALVAGTGLSFLLHPEVSWPQLSLGWEMPQLIWPSLVEFKQSLFMVVIPQLPLTLANAVLVTAALSSELYGTRAARATEKNLSLSMGIGNLVAAPLGGYMMCHGSGGVAAHYRFGGRTGRTSLIIGLALVLIGLLLGNDGVKLLGLVPEAVLGCLLFYGGLDLALSARNVQGKEDLFLVFSVAALTLAVNPAVAFLAGLAIARGQQLSEGRRDTQ